MKYNLLYKNKGIEITIKLVSMPFSLRMYIAAPSPERVPDNILNALSNTIPPAEEVNSFANRIELMLFRRSENFMWVEGVSKAISDVVDRDDGEEDHQAGEDRQPRIFGEVFLCVAEQVAP